MAPSRDYTGRQQERLRRRLPARLSERSERLTDGTTAWYAGTRAKVEEFRRSLNTLGERLEDSDSSERSGADAALFAVVLAGALLGRWSS